eukprot:scaffold40742_cov15-Prasinocladus_malaysianus.AAC.1
MECALPANLASSLRLVCSQYSVSDASNKAVSSALSSFVIKRPDFIWRASLLSAGAQNSPL